MDRKAVSPVIAIVLLLMMTVAAAGAAYFWLTTIQSGMQKQSTKSIENIMQKSGRKLMAQGAICKPTAPEGMVGWWEFYEGGGNKTHDSSENENTGTLYPGSEGSITSDSGMWVAGKVGQALDFDGSDDYVGIPLSDSFSSIKGEITVSGWVNFDVVDDIVIGQGNPNYAFTLNIAWSQKCSFGIVNESDSRQHAVGPSLEADKWYHLVGTYDKSLNSDNIKLYVNGDLVATADQSGDINILSSRSITIGSTGGGYWLDGTIDEARIYDRALSQSEINETYKGKMKVKVTVRNVGSVEVPEAKFVANLKKDGTTVDSDTYVTKSTIDTGDLKTLTFYFNEMRPGGEYNINIPGIDVSQTVNCQSLEG